ncbi:MAG: hypothetical protein Q4B77_05265 [Coriobacteriaceae bacterium]|nr:hypothetical protein [Coriobacteriaceae bacterium]
MYDRSFGSNFLDDDFLYNASPIDELNKFNKLLDAINSSPSGSIQRINLLKELEASVDKDITEMERAISKTQRKILKTQFDCLNNVGQYPFPISASLYLNDSERLEELEREQEDALFKFRLLKNKILVWKFRELRDKEENDAQDRRREKLTGELDRLKSRIDELSARIESEADEKTKQELEHEKNELIDQKKQLFHEWLESLMVKYGLSDDD